MSIKLIEYLNVKFKRSTVECIMKIVNKQYYSEGT